ncbi:MAG: hypothetical protein F6K25_12515 [Okeania sp. SIO2G4]|uniref:hypothetical protein n=1 Tax=unclassified Okeania TaxID=2634635 RepID=UPI0013BA7BA0|nr:MULTISPECIES: hypothetical protein [unclassified Okeania]NEP05734.1 hypothetical protein [Okeania sp. SIO4D6]NEP74884.1 hypothetical protein [Okeania sp. SIO2G5]NEP94990.1 hypothetical protein [Okeania sp. SIO2F5]NEQ91482.1 hypothetical protein [Okeania sp. SIO2G4]
MFWFIIEEGRRKKEEGRGKKEEGRRLKRKLLIDSQRPATCCLQTPNDFKHFC